MSNISYEERVQAQIAQYANTVNMQDLPAIFSVWSMEFIAPGGGLTPAEAPLRKPGKLFKQTEPPLRVDL